MCIALLWVMRKYPPEALTLVALTLGTSGGGGSYRGGAALGGDGGAVRIGSYFCNAHNDVITHIRHRLNTKPVVLSLRPQ